MQVIETIELIQGSATVENLKNNVLKLIKGVDALEQLTKSESEDSQTDE